MKKMRETHWCVFPQASLADNPVWLYPKTKTSRTSLSFALYLYLEKVSPTSPQAAVNGGVVGQSRRARFLSCASKVSPPRGQQQPSPRGARRAGGVVQSWISVRTGVLAHRASVRDIVREDRKTMEELFLFFDFWFANCCNW